MPQRRCGHMSEASLRLPRSTCDGPRARKRTLIGTSGSSTPFFRAGRLQLFCTALEKEDNELRALSSWISRRYWPWWTLMALLHTTATQTTLSWRRRNVYIGAANPGRPPSGTRWVTLAARRPRIAWRRWRSPSPIGFWDGVGVSGANLAGPTSNA